MRWIHSRRNAACDCGDRETRNDPARFAASCAGLVKLALGEEKSLLCGEDTSCAARGRLVPPPRLTLAIGLLLRGGHPSSGHTAAGVFQRSAHKGCQLKRKGINHGVLGCAAYHVLRFIAR